MKIKISYIKNFLPLIGVILFIYILWKIGIGNIVETISRVNVLFLIISFLIFIPRIFISTYKWQLISKKQGINLNLIHMLKINLIGLFYGTITPLWIGDAIRIFYVKEASKKSWGKCIANYTLDQLIEFFSLYILAIIGSILLIQVFPTLSITLIIIFILILSISLVLKNGKIGKKFFNFIYRTILPEKMKDKVETYSNEFYKDMPSLKFLLIPLAIEIFSYSLFFLQIYIVAIALHVNAPLYSFIFIYPIASLIGQIPITISGFGTREGALINLFKIFGVGSTQIVTVSLTSYIITFLIPVIIGMYYSFKIKLKLE